MVTLTRLSKSEQMPKDFHFTIAKPENRVRFKVISTDQNMDAKGGVMASGRKIRVIVTIERGGKDGIFQIRHSLDTEEGEEGDQRGDMLSEEIIFPTRIKNEAT
jgi:hypothetical protein